jgi:hypothetical protein
VGCAEFLDAPIWMPHMGTVRLAEPRRQPTPLSMLQQELLRREYHLEKVFDHLAFLAFGRFGKDQESLSA